MVTIKQWGDHSLRIAKINNHELMLLDDLAQALGLDSEELVSTVRNEFVIIHYVKDDPAIEDGSHVFLSRRGVYQALWLADTDEAAIFQDFASTLIRLHFLGPATESDFEFLDICVAKNSKEKPVKERKHWRIRKGE